jgi:hypothetical protein
MRRRATILSLLSLVVALAWPAGSSATAPNNQAASYEFFMEEPNVAMASSGDTISITGEGEFAVHPKSATGEGEFTAMSAGGQTVAGTWTVNGLVDFQPYGCGVIPSIGATLPPNLCGGRLSLDVTFTAPDGSVPGRITVFCVIGPQAPPTHDNPTEAGEEGVTAVVPGIDNFNKQVSGMNVYVQQ